MKQKQLSLKGNMLWNSMGSLLYLGCQWLITVLVVRLSSGYDAAGQLALGMAVSNVFSPIGYYKIRSFQVSDIRREYSLSDYIGLRVVTVFFSFLVMLSYGSLTCSIDLLPVVFLYGIYSLLPIVADVFHGEAQLRNRMDIIGLDLALRGLTSLVIFVVIMAVFNSLEFALISMTIGCMLILVIYTIPAVKNLNCEIYPSFSFAVIRTLLVSCFPAVIALLCASLVPTVPRQILESIYGTGMLGIYASVAAPIAILQMGVQYLYSPLLGTFAELFLKGDRDGFVKLLLKILSGCLLFAVLACLVLSFVGVPCLVFLYGTDIVEYNYLINPLILASVVTALFWFASDLLIVVRDFAGTLLSSILAFVVCLGSTTFLLNTMGLNGASYSVILSFAIAGIYAMYRVGKKSVVNKAV